MISTLPLDENAAPVRRSPDPRNTAIREERPNRRFLDAWPVFWYGAASGLRRSLHNGDGLHLSPAGSRALEALVRAAVDEIARSGEGAR